MKWSVSTILSIDTRRVFRPNAIFVMFSHWASSSDWVWQGCSFVHPDLQFLMNVRSVSPLENILSLECKTSPTLKHTGTDAVSVDVEERLYETATKMGITVITISKRLALESFHEQELRLGEMNKNGFSLRNV